MTQVESPITVKAMAPDSAGSSLTELFSGILSDTQTLFRQQIELVRAEFVEDLRRTKQVAKCFGIGSLLLTVGVVMLLVAGVHLLEHLTAWPLWACWATVAATALVLGIVSFVVGSRILANFNPLPNKSINALQETVSCLTNPQK